MKKCKQTAEMNGYVFELLHVYFFRRAMPNVNVNNVSLCLANIKFLMKNLVVQDVQ